MLVLIALQVDASGDPGAEVVWEAYAFRDMIVLRYGLILVGWPYDIYFGNLSKIEGGVQTIRRLLSLFEQRRLRFRKATAGEIFAARESVYNAVPGFCEIANLPEVCRRDLGKRKARPSVDSTCFPPRFVRNGPKSLAWVRDEDDL